jgi:hypothetical protein
MKIIGTDRHMIARRNNVGINRFWERYVNPREESQYLTHKKNRIVLNYKIKENEYGDF